MVLSTPVPKEARHRPTSVISKIIGRWVLKNDEEFNVCPFRAYRKRAGG
jgi:hypothetical protein